MSLLEVVGVYNLVLCGTPLRLHQSINQSIYQSIKTKISVRMNIYIYFFYCHELFPIFNFLIKYDERKKKKEKRRKKRKKSICENYNKILCLIKTKKGEKKYIFPQFVKKTFCTKRGGKGNMTFWENLYSLCTLYSPGPDTNVRQSSAVSAQALNNKYCRIRVLNLEAF